MRIAGTTNTAHAYSWVSPERGSNCPCLSSVSSLLSVSVFCFLYVIFCFSGEAEWKVANSEWGRNWMVINDLSPNMEYEVRLVAKNKHGDMASSTLYRVKTQPRQGTWKRSYDKI
ncbi:hypothetical protein DPMN_108865 [Dreissena polymorpha]|uniref:Fibronectin type-III domain-containing protein n=1 Tax=Dreissena polymorpha TaxID=45954 RepID=A0A9D4K9X3_DREPO|nr:hypothetical protein DPMN_108865 [Dreissena polymorpha]